MTECSDGRDRGTEYLNNKGQLNFAFQVDSFEQLHNQIPDYYLAEAVFLS